MQRANGRSKRKSTYMNKCPYEWRLTHNIQNRDRTKTRTDTHTKRLFDKEKKNNKKKSRFSQKRRNEGNNQIGSVRDST
jgi:hypothetical protein